MSHAVGAANVSSCAGLMTVNLLDDAFTLNIDHSTALTKGTVATGLCTLADNQGFVGEVFADPVIKDCDFSGNDKFCTVTFTLVKDDKVMSGAEPAVCSDKVAARSTWWGRTQRTRSTSMPRSHAECAWAKVYQRDLSGTGWEVTPLATLNAGDASCISALIPRLTIAGPSCGSTWYQLDGNSTDIAAADVLVDNVVKRVDGVPLKFADQGGRQGPVLLPGGQPAGDAQQPGDHALGQRRHDHRAEPLQPPPPALPVT